MTPLEKKRSLFWVEGLPDWESFREPWHQTDAALRSIDTDTLGPGVVMLDGRPFEYVIEDRWVRVA